MGSLSQPVAAEWFAFPPRALLFGAELAHYNCLSRAIAVLTKLISGIPLLPYFDDFGELPPMNLGNEAIATYKMFPATVGF